MDRGHHVADGEPPFEPAKGRVYLAPKEADRRNVRVLVDKLPNDVSKDGVRRAVAAAGRGKIILKG